MMDNRQYDPAAIRESIRQAEERAQREESAKQAEIDVALAKARALVAEHDATLEAERQAKQAELEAARKQEAEAAEARLKNEARLHYVGTDASFEQDWPSIRASLNASRISQEQEARRGQDALYREW